MACGRRQRAEGKCQRQMAKKWAQTNSTSHIKCLRQREGKTTQDHTKHMECGRGQIAEGKCQRQMANNGHKPIQQATPHVWDKKKVKPHRTTHSKWNVAEGREQRASAKDRWQTKGTNQFNKLHQMSETNRK